MISLNIPSYKYINLRNIVLDFNGTLATDGIVKESIKDKLNGINDMQIYVLTADTYGNAKEELKNLKVNLKIISKENGTKDKVQFIRELDSNTCIAFGNGNNDSLMLKEAEIGVCVLGDEGCAKETLNNSDIIVKNIDDGLDLILKPKRIIADLRK